MGKYRDELIKAGTLQIIKPIDYKKVFIKEAHKHSGKIAVIMGSGGWCRPFHSIAQFLPIIEERFEKVIILPTSFDPSVEIVKKILSNSKSIVFARELISYELIKNLCNADFAYDGAFFFDYSPWKQKGTGTLNAYRIDRERRKEKNSFAFL